MEQRNKERAQEYKELLSLAGHLVSVKMLKDKEEFEGIKKPQKPFTLCQLISQTHYYGRRVIATAEDVSACYAAPRILGFGELPKEPWKRYLGWHFANEEAGKKSFEKFPAFSLGEYKSILISPLERCPVEPDVVIFFGSAAQLMPIILGYLSDKGGELKFRVNGMFACGDAIVTPMKDKRPNIVVPGNSWRILALPSDTELICGLPGELIEENLAGIKFLRSKGGARYPLLWQHLDWGPLGTITEVLRPEGLPTWLK